TTFLTSSDSPAFCSFMRRFLYLPIQSIIRQNRVLSSYLLFFSPFHQGELRREEKRDGTDLTNGLHYPPDSVTGSCIRVPSRLPCPDGLRPLHQKSLFCP